MAEMAEHAVPEIESAAGDGPSTDGPAERRRAGATGPTAPSDDADESTPSPDGATRGRVVRIPQQARSRARVDRLVNAADEILATEGYDALTVRRIAEVAGTPVGSIYQFFADKNAIVDVVAKRYRLRFADVLEELVDEAQSAHWDNLADTVLDRFVAMYRANPGYLAIGRSSYASQELARAEVANNLALADGLRRILIAQVGLPDSDELAHACRVAVGAGEALLRLAFRDAPDGDPQLIAEAKRMERVYLQDVVARLAPRRRRRVDPRPSET